MGLRAGDPSTCELEVNLDYIARLSNKQTNRTHKHKTKKLQETVGEIFSMLFSMKA
jgi:hypothetical protein